MIGFAIEDPFHLSLDLYFRKVQYNIVTNLTDTFASTGIYSEPFKKIFLHISTEIR